MNLSSINWHKEYDSFIKYLYTLQNKKYLNFHSNLVKEKNIIGIRIPLLRKIALEISKGDYKSFIKNNKHETYEETMIHGLVLGYIKEPFKDVLDDLKAFIPYNDNWAVNDTVCSNLKAFKNNLDEGFIFINELLNTNSPWSVRFALVLLLDYYINDKYIDKLFNIIDNIDTTEYYVMMANAWLISICFIKYSDKTMKYLLNNNLDKTTFNKSIEKICDSYRVSNDIKINLKKIKR